MVSKEEVKELFNLAEVEEKEEEMRRKAAYEQTLEAEKKGKAARISG